jgi:16S rRNA (cytidine1402-2'-O)-methyltransferase
LPSSSTTEGVLYVVSTPIGNLQDITLRALEVLGTVDLVACEDTRVTAKLLSRHEIRVPTVSFHARSKAGAVEGIARVVSGGSKVAYVTDSGTPTVSDPGATLVRRIIDDGGEVIPVPGPSAIHAVIAASGLAFSSYSFHGFLSNKAARRRRAMEELCAQKTVLVFYESPHRLSGFLHDVLDIFGDIPCVVAKEVTKRFERFYRGNIGKVIKNVEGDGIRGEYTVVLDNRSRK